MTRRPRRRRPSDPSIAIAYIRASTEEQVAGPKAQRDAIERWARANGVRVVATFDDLGVSGGAQIEDRPGLLGAVDALGVHNAGLLIVAKRDRLARDVVVAAMIERLVQRSGAKIVAADGAGNGDGPEAEMMRGIVAVFAQYERAIIRARTKSALAAKHARGERTSRYAPLGYTFGPDGRTLVPLASEQAIAKRVRTMHATGLSFSEVARRLNAERVPSRGARWYPGSVATLVRAAI